MARIDMRMHFATVLMEMCDVWKLSEITTSDVIREAHVARQTFYNHFDDMDDLICFAATRGLFSGGLPFSSIENTRRSYEFALEHPGFFSQLASHKGQNNFRDAYNSWLKSFCRTQFLDGCTDERERSRRCIGIDLFIAGSTDIMLNWYASGMVVPVDDMVQVLVDAAPRFITERAMKTPTVLPDYPK